MTDNFFPDFDEHMNACALESQRSYELRILKLLYKHLFSDAELRAARCEAGEDFGLSWFNDLGAVPIILFARKKVAVNPAHVISTAGFTKTRLWEAYFDEKNKMPKGTAMAMFFPMTRMGQFVIHNAAFLDIVPGHNIVMRSGGSTVLRIEHAKSFMLALAARFRQ